jgi:hypothetical protein
MRRREFIRLLCGGAAAWPLAARAQELERAYRIGVLNVNPREHPIFVALFDEMRRLGFVEGRNLIVDGRGFAARNDQLSEIAPELAKGKVDAILCGGGGPPIRALQKAPLDLLDHIVGKREEDWDPFGCQSPACSSCQFSASRL